MSNISFSQYIQITSGVAGGNAVATRQFIGRVFSPNATIDPAAILTFSGGAQAALASIGAYFGITSEEYLRAVQYFAFISPNIRQPQALSYARWCFAAAPCSIYGASGTYVYSVLAAYTAGVLKFNFNGTVVEVTGITLAAATTLATVASILQTALRLNADAHLTTCTVTYDATNNRFDFIASPGSVTAGTFAMVQDGTVGTTDLAAALGWYATQGAYVLSSNPSEQPVAAVTRANGISNNYGSFCFCTGTDPLTLIETEAVASYNAALGVMFQYHSQVTPANASSWSAALIANAGFGLEYALPANTDYPEMAPMSIMAATDYTQRNGVLNYGFKVLPGLQVSVSDDTTKGNLDSLRINYYGQTETAGQEIAFFQNGYLCGSAVAPQAMNIYANEQWFRDYLGSGLMNLQLGLGELSANAQGVTQIMAVMQGAATAALFNGTFSPGKPLTVTQQLYITEQTGDDLAWIKVQNGGYWMNCTLSSAVVNSLTVWTANYTFIYSKNDAIMKISGTHQLI